MPVAAALLFGRFPRTLTPARARLHRRTRHWLSAWHAPPTMDAQIASKRQRGDPRQDGAALDSRALSEFGRRLRAWYRRSARDLPWRRTRSAYRVLVSELMLQQTQVARVIPRYEAFLERFPTLHHVAAAPPARVMEAWEGLGYYARARNLHRLARQVTAGGATGTLP